VSICRSKQPVFAAGGECEGIVSVPRHGYLLHRNRTGPAAATRTTAICLAGLGVLPAEMSPTGDKTGKNAIAGALATADPQAVVEGVRRFFSDNGLLSREEFLLIAKRATRS